MGVRAPGRSERDFVYVVVRSCVVALNAVLMMLIADLVAMARVPSAMVRNGERTRPRGDTRSPLECDGFLCPAALARAGRAASHARPAMRPGRPIGVFICSIAALVVYPVEWRTGLYGALATAVTGMLLLFIGAAALTDVSLPTPADPQHDVLDEWSRLTGRTWLAPRRHPIGFALFVAILGGMTLALIEAAGEGLPSQSRRAVLVVGVFVGIEASGILVGLGLFNEKLQLIRRTPWISV